MSNLSSKLKVFAERLSGQDTSLDRDLLAKVAGVTFEGRQEILARLELGSEITLERDRRNPYDFYAVKVMAMVDNSWHHVGFLPKMMSKLVSNSLDQGINFYPQVHRIIGGVYSDHKQQQLNYGLEIKLKRNN